MSRQDKRPRTKLVEGGRRKEWRGRLVNPPVERASTILFDSVAELQRQPARRSAPTATACRARRPIGRLSEALTELEPGAAGTALYSSGLAAITTALLAVLRARRRTARPRQRLRADARASATRSSSASASTTRYYDPLIGARHRAS